MKNANLVSRATIVTVLLAAGLVACAKDKPAVPPTAVASGAPKSVRDFFRIKVGDATVRMQLAVRSEEMQRGLMGRRDLGRDDGMIFVYDKVQQMTFWMRSTPTPLDIGFFTSDGTLVEVHALHPFDENTVASHSKELRFALEMNQGWYRANGIKPGTKLDVQGLAEALRARGFKAEKFGL